MNGQTTTDNSSDRILLPGLILCLVSGFSFAQVPVDEDGNPIAYSEQGPADAGAAPVQGAVITPDNPEVLDGTAAPAEDLEALVGRIALYPDDLLAIVLPASTYPLEIVQAARFLELLESNPDLEPDGEWDESIVALLNYPDVINMMNDDIDWTWRLGDAVISQQADVIAAVEVFRDRAYAAGNLKSDDRQVVSNDDGVIEIEPVSEEIIYVPYYEPEEVVVYQPRPVYYYYPEPYPSYYYPYPASHRFRSRHFWGVTTAFSIGWSNHYLNVYHPSYRGHPYYGYNYNYYGHYYRRPSISIYNTWYGNNNRRSVVNRHRSGDRWRPRSRAGSRQIEPRVRNEHYPPGRVETRRGNAAARSRLDNRRNGRMDLGLRQRDAADRARVASRGSNNRQPGFAPSRENSNRASTSRRESANSNRRQNRQQTAAGNRTRTDTGTRFRSSTDRASNRQNRSRNDSNRAVNSREPNRSTTNANQRRLAAANSGRTNARNPRNENRPTVNSRQPVNRSTNNRASTNRQSSNRPPANRQSTRRSATNQTPTFRAPRPRTTTSSSSRQRPAVNSSRSAPRPRASAPSRSSAPRSSAPRSSAPRTNRPTASRPQVAAPRANTNRSSSSSRSRSSASGQSRRGATRSRTRNN